MMRTSKIRAPKVMQRITGKDKMPGSGGRNELFPEEKKFSSFLEKIKSLEKLKYLSHILCS